MTETFSSLQDKVAYYKSHPPETDYQRGYVQALEDAVGAPVVYERESWFRVVDEAVYNFLYDALQYGRASTLVVTILSAIAIGTSGAIGFALGALLS